MAGVGFTATCSLVAVDPHGLPVTVSPSGGNVYIYHVEVMLHWACVCVCVCGSRSAAKCRLLARPSCGEGSS